MTRVCTETGIGVQVREGQFAVAAAAADQQGVVPAVRVLVGVGGSDADQGPVLPAVTVRAVGGGPWLPAQVRPDRQVDRPALADPGGDTVVAGDRDHLAQAMPARLGTPGPVVTVDLVIDELADATAGRQCSGQQRAGQGGLGGDDHVVGTPAAVHRLGSSVQQTGRESCRSRNPCPAPVR